MGTSVASKFWKSSRIRFCFLFTLHTILKPLFAQTSSFLPPPHPLDTIWVTGFLIYYTFMLPCLTWFVDSALHQLASYWYPWEIPALWHFTLLVSQSLERFHIKFLQFCVMFQHTFSTFLFFSLLFCQWFLYQRNVFIPLRFYLFVFMTHQFIW